MEIEIMGKTFPLRYTVRAQEIIEDECGADVTEALNQGGVQSVKAAAVMVSAMMRAAEERERVRCALYGLEYHGEEALTSQQVAAAMDLSDIKRYMDAVTATINEGQKTTTEVETPKKRKATPSE